MAVVLRIKTKSDEIDAGRAKPEVDAEPDAPASSKGRFHVTVVSAEGLPKRDLFGENDPFVVVNVNDATSRTSAAYDGGATPRWGRGGQGERLTFLLTKPPNALHIKVLDDDFNPADLLGHHHSLAALKGKIQEKIGSAADDIGEADGMLSTSCCSVFVAERD